MPNDLGFPPPAQPGRPNFPTAIIGPNPLLCESLSRFLHGSAFNIVTLASSVGELSSSKLPADQDTLVIIDACDHPGEMGDHIERFKVHYPKARIVVLANHCAPGEVAHVVHSGAHGYFATIATCDDFIKSLELVMGGQTILPSEGVSSALLREAACAGTAAATRSFDRRRLCDASELPQFSERELYILQCLTEGSANKVIARDCNIAEGTVKVHVKAILRKIKVSNRTQAAIWALNNKDLVWPDAMHETADITELPAEPSLSNTTVAACNLNGATSDNRISDLTQKLKYRSEKAVSK